LKFALKIVYNIKIHYNKIQELKMRLLAFVFAALMAIPCVARAADELVHTLMYNNDVVKTAVFTKDQNFVLSGGAEKFITKWRIDRTLSDVKLVGHTAMVNRVRVSPSGAFAASCSNDRTIKIWSLTSNKIARTLRGHTHYVNSVVYSKDGKHLVSASADKTVKMWNASTGAIVKTFTGHNDIVREAVITSGANYIISVSEDGTAKVFSVKTGQVLHTFKQNAYLLSVAVSPNGKYVACGAEDGNLYIFNFTDGTLRGETKIFAHAQGVTALTFSKDSAFVISGGADGNIKLWNAKTKQFFSVLEGHSDIVYDVNESPDGKNLISASEDTSIKIWSPAVPATGGEVSAEIDIIDTNEPKKDF
jgi:WD40 repeat protein